MPGTLQVTFRGGEPLAAYLDLGRRPGVRSASTDEAAPGLLVDYDRVGRPLGVEIVDPGVVSLAALNRLLRRLHLRPLTRAEWAPLRAA